MKIVDVYSHLGGAELLSSSYPDIDNEINSIIHNVVARQSKVSKEQTMQGEKLYDPAAMNHEFGQLFGEHGYKELKWNADFVTPKRGKYLPREIQTGHNQVDYAKDRVNIEIQFGKYTFLFYDMVKFQYFYDKDKIDVGVEITPSRALANQMSTGVSCGESLITYMELLKRRHPVVPIKVILIEPDDVWK